MQKKTIIFGCQKTYSLSDEIVKNLEYLGFEVIDVSFAYDFKYKSKKQKIINFLRKTFLNDTNYKKKLRFESVKESLENKIKNLSKKADYSLIIRPDSYPKEFIKLIKENSEKTIGYQWDGINRFPNIKSYFKYFDRFFVFDPSDVNLEKKLLPTTNFYFDYNLKNNLNNSNNVYFLGNFFENRIQATKKIVKAINKAGLQVDIYFYTNDKSVIEKYKNSGVKFTNKYISFEENLKKMEDSSVLLDFINGKHNGLSFRTFEAIGNDKKLITNNAEVKKYDFYHPDNFFVWEDENFEELEEFLKKPYQPLSPEIKEKYSFTNWIHYVLGIEPFINITLP